MALGMVVILIFLSPFSAAEAQRQPSGLIIKPGSSLFPASPPTSWSSNSHAFAFGFYKEGDAFAVGIWLIGQPNNTTVWTARRDYQPVSSNSNISFTIEGKLLLYTEQKAYPIANISSPAMSASMLDSGNFVLLDEYSSVIWESFAFPTDTLLGGQNLSQGKELVSSVSRSDHSSGRFLLTMQTDGNLVAYPVNSSQAPEDAYWASNTYQTTYERLRLNQSGYLFLETDQGLQTQILVSGSSAEQNDTIIYRATLDDDGIFRLYSHRFRSGSSTASNPSVIVKWPMLQNPCDVSGYCGLNSYCSSKGGERAACSCYPGFAPVDHSERFTDCYRNFSEDPCRKDLKYNISTIEDVKFRFRHYSKDPMKKEACRKSCAEDCDCGAALYFNETCQKFKLPLTYGAIYPGLNTTGFFRVVEEDQVSLGTGTVVIENKKGLITILATSLGSITCLCIAIAMFSFLLYRHQVCRYKKLYLVDANLGLREEDITLRSFSYDELDEATGGFKEVLGRGSYGTVYKGTVSGAAINKVVAVKRLENVVKEGENKFKSEVNAIGRTHHRNLVRLLGFCVEGSRKLLVYEYMSNGSLADLLKVNNFPSWRARVRIVLDIARGVHYLHEECETCIIHFGIKPRNILMDESWTAKISDFGMAKILVKDVATGGGGEQRDAEGYLAPEWQQNASVSVKTDVYSFGIVLLEIICWRSNIKVDVPSADEFILSTWAYKCFVAGQLHLLVEEDGEQVDMKNLERMVKIGLWCIQEDPNSRPLMKNVLEMLEGNTSPPTSIFSILGL
ncbi:Non-specific serine/threonine protein kinase [Bertholletia excelsa]